MENNQYKGFAYTKEGNKPTAVYGTSPEDILAKLNSYNVARMEKDKFITCNIGSLNEETSKYEEYHRYDVATGKDISSVYLQIPPLKKAEFQKVVADLKAAGARFNVQKKAWYISADQDQQGFQDICNQFSNNTVEIDSIRDSEEPEKPNFMIEGVEVQYAVKMQNQQTVLIPESDVNMLKLEGSMNEFLDRLNERAVGQLQQISGDLEQIDPGQVASESEYMISVDRDSHFNRCTVWFNDGREPVSLNGYVYGLDFLSMETDAVAEFVSEYLRQQDHPELRIQTEYRVGDRIDCYVPLNPQESSAIRPDQSLYVEGIRHITGTVQAVRNDPPWESNTEAKSYEILDEYGSVQTIRSDEIYALDQARVLLRAAADELTKVQFDLLADKRLTAAQMEEVRFGFKDGLATEQVALYANPEMTPAEMDLCRIGLANGLEYAELSSLLKETKELSWTDSRNRLDEVIKEHREQALETEPVREDQPVKEDPSGPEKEAEELSEIQQHIVEHIQDNFVKGTVSIEPVGNDKIRITDLKGESMNLAMSQSGGIIDADTNKIYGYAKDGYRPPAAPAQEDQSVKGAYETASEQMRAGDNEKLWETFEKALSRYPIKQPQTAVFYGIEVPIENGRRVIPQEAVYDVLARIEKPDFSGCDFRGIDFSSDLSFSLSNINFAFSRFYDCKFYDADMHGSYFMGALLHHTNFKNGTLRECDFSHARFYNCMISAMDVVKVNFSKATMDQVNIENCAMEENDFYMTRMDSVNVSASCDITADQKNLNTVTYTICKAGIDPAEIEKMKDKVMWRLSGSEITYERKEEMSRLFRDESNDPDTQEWREDLTYEERDLVESWEKQRSDVRVHICEDITKSGYTPTEKLISNIQKLDAITGERHSLKDVVNLYRQNNFQNNQELSKAVLDIAEECKQQELARMAAPEMNVPG